MPDPDLPSNGELHARFARPGWQYTTTEGPRKQWDEQDTPPDGSGWVRNTDAGRDGWERFDYTERSYWRRTVAEVPVDLAAWLTAQFDADEAIARAATRGAWELVDIEDGDGFEIRSDQSPTGRPRTEFRWVSNHVYDRPDAEHIARWDPARVLAEIAAKRKRLAMHRPISSDVDAGEIICAHCTPTDDHYMGVPCPCDDVLLDAAPYAGRDGWKDEWTVA